MFRLPENTLGTTVNMSIFNKTFFLEKKLFTHCLFDSRRFIQFLLDQTGTNVDLFHVFGHSLGAHVAGEAGETLGGILPRISGNFKQSSTFFRGLD